MCCPFVTRTNYFFHSGWKIGLPFCRRDFDHYPEFEVRAPLQSFFFHDALRVPKLFDSSDEGEHYVNIGELELFPYLPNCPAFQSEDIRFFDISETAPVA